MQLLKRIFLIVVSFALISIIISPIASRAHAQYYPSYMNLDTNPDVPQNFHTYSNVLVLNVLSAIACELGGFDPLTNSHQCLGYDSQTGRIGYVNNHGGALGFLTTTIAATFNLPVHANSYVQYLASNFHVASDKSYAAESIGAKGLAPILKIWIGFRNVAYLFAVIIFLVLGMLIMFRVKIDPRTVMSIQNQIPKIIMGLLLITFSYAIAGLLIDFMYVLTILMLNITAQATGDTGITKALLSATEPFGAMNNSLPGGIIGAIMGTTGTVAGIASNIIIQNPVGQVVNVILQGLSIILLIIPTAICNIIQGIGGFIGGNLQTTPCIVQDTNALGQATAGIVGVLVFIILLVAILTSLFRFWISLIQTYLTILFNIVLSPMRILFGVIPGGPGGGISGWFKELIANLAVFPVSIGFIALAGELVKAVSNAPSFTPYLVPGGTLGGVLGFAATLMLPKLPDTVKEWFKVKGGGLGDAISQTLGVGAAAAGLGVRTFGRKAFQRELSLQGQSEGFLRRLALGPQGGTTSKNPLDRARWRLRQFVERALLEKKA